MNLRAPIFAQALRLALEESGILGVVRSYSGRAMYGKECIGLFVDYELDTFALGLAVYEQLTYFSSEVAGTQFPAMQSDNMGRGMVYYWPDMDWWDECEE